MQTKTGWLHFSTIYHGITLEYFEKEWRNADQTRLGEERQTKTGWVKKCRPNQVDSRSFPNFRPWLFPLPLITPATWSTLAPITFDSHISGTEAVHQTFIPAFNSTTARVERPDSEGRRIESQRSGNSQPISGNKTGSTFCWSSTIWLVANRFGPTTVRTKR